MSTGIGTGEQRAGMLEMFGFKPLTRAQVATIAERASVHPLGSPENPVRAFEPAGQREYISRLRCEDGRAPDVLGRGNIGAGIYSTIVDVYQLSCRSGGERQLAMDMYHDWIENAPAAGFTIVPREGV
jgi:hypothetical protein